MPPINKLFRTYQGAVISVLLLLFCLGSVMFGVVPAAKKVQEGFDEMKVLSEQTVSLKKKLAALDALDEDTLRTKLTNVLAAVPPDRSFPTLFETVEVVAAQTGVSITDLSLSGGATLATPSAAKLSAADKKLGTRTIPFSVTVKGPLESLETFIALVPNVRRLLRTRTFSITFPKEAGPVGVVLGMDAFYEPLPTNLGSAKTVLPQLTAADEGIITRLTAMPLAVQSAVAPEPLIGKVKSDPFSP